MERTEKYMGIFDLAMTMEKREGFLSYRRKKQKDSIEEMKEITAYISSDACKADLMRLRSGDYFLDPPLHRRIPKNFSERKRELYLWKGPANWLFSLLCFVMRDYDSMYSDGLYSFRTSVDARDFLMKLKSYERREDYYIVKADVSSYVSSIVPEVIIKRLEQIWKDDPAFLNFLRFILFRRKCIERDGSVADCEPGGLGGCPLSNHFMNVNLMELDEYIQPRAALYCRYSDDIIIFCQTKEEAEEYFDFLYRTLEEKKLRTNPEKTFLIPPGGEVEILGCKLKDGKMDVSNHAKKKLKRKIRRYANKMLACKKEQHLSDEEAGRRLVSYCNHLFYGKRLAKDFTWARWLFPVITVTDSLKELDHYVQDAVRYVMCGSMGDKKYRIRYDQIREFGYKSLVHAYYHFSWA